MKTLLQRIKEDQLLARKERNTIKASFLTTLIGESEMIGKSADNRISTDAEVLQVIRKFEKNALENVKMFSDSTDPHKLAFAYTSSNELMILREFLPQKVSDKQVEQNINTILVEHSLAKEQKSLGAIVKSLKIAYGDQFDGQQVSNIFKSML